MTPRDYTVRDEYHDRPVREGESHWFMANVPKNPKPGDRWNDFLYLHGVWRYRPRQY